MPDMDQRTFWGIARAHLLNVGIIRPGPHVTAIEINVYLSSPTGAPVTVGKITDQDKADVPRFLNRSARSTDMCPMLFSLQSYSMAYEPLSEHNKASSLSLVGAVLPPVCTGK